MAKTVTPTGTKSVKVYNPKFLYVTPFTDSKTKGDVIYNLENVIRDTTAITQEENTDNLTESEFASEPIANNVTAGKYTFAAEVGDMQPDLLKMLGGFTISAGADTSKAYAPSGYKEIFAEIALVYQAGDKYFAAILPKCQLNAKVAMDSINTSVGRIVLAGTGYNMTVDENVTPFIVDADYKLPVAGGA